MDLGDTIAETQHVFADALPVLVMMSDPSGVVNFFNTAWFQYTGQPRFDRDVTEEWRKYIHPDDVPIVGAAWYAAMESGKDVAVEYRVYHAASGEWRWFSAHAHALRDAAGKIVQWIGTAMEIHEVRQANAALEALYRHERQVATSFQEAALPEGLPTLPGMSLDAVYQPSSNLLVGGDWYDAFALSNGAVAIAVGDVTGHGLEAAVLMSKLRQSFRAVTIRAAQFENRDPGSIVASVEQTMLMENTDFTASVFFGIVDSELHVLEYSSAGHPPAVLLRLDGTVELLSNGDMLLGFPEAAPRTSAKVSLANAQALVCYTDGLTEASRDVFEGEARLHDAVKTWHVTSQAKPASHVLEEVVKTPAADDIAILTVTFASRAR